MDVRLCDGMMRRAAALIVAVALVGCAPRSTPPPAAGEALTAADWTLTELRGSAVLASSSGRAPSLRLAEGESRVSGFTGCNQLMGRYSVDGDRLGFPEPMATTRMACSDPAASQQEQRYLQALQEARRFSVQGRQLTLYGEGNELLARFTAGD